MNRRILNFGIILTAIIAATVFAPAVISVFSSNFDTTGIQTAKAASQDYSIEVQSEIVEEVAGEIKPPKELALEHLKEIMNKYHSSFDVYSDLSAAGNHFVVPAKMGKDAEINLSHFENPHSGDTCIENKFNGIFSSWGGWYLMNGVLVGEEIQPKANWGEYPDAGFNLIEATKLSFWARGKEGGERVEFFAFGVGRDPNTGITIAPYPDSSPKISLGYITLNREWEQYTIDLNGVDLSYVVGGFGWVTNAAQNNNLPITFYLDDIKYDKEHLDEPRFLVSYELLPSDEPVLKNTAFIYDNVLVLLSFLSNHTEEDIEHAKLIGDALVYAIDHDRYFTDGRLRNTYQGGDLKLFPGWEPHSKNDTVRMPGWMDAKNNTWHEDKSFVGTHTGNIAWSIIALLSLYEETHEEKYLTGSVRLGEWIENECRDDRGAGGYTGGYEGWEPTANNPEGQTRISWKATEHNIDIYVAFSRLSVLTGDDVWRERGLHAKHFVEAMWDVEEKHFWTGTLEDGVTINKANIPADIHAWSLMALEEIDKYRKGMNWVENNCYVEVDGFKGFDFNNDTDGIWFEGTAHMIIAYQILGDRTQSNLYLDELRNAQKEASNTNGKGLVAASHDSVSTGFDWIYDARLHTGATAWFIFGETGYNPYWAEELIFMDMFRGWNLISLPLMPDDSNIASVLSPISGNYSIVWAYNASDTADHWKKYDPNAPFGNDLKNLEPGNGYWIMMTSDDILSIIGTIPETANVNLLTGWNLIGYNSLESQPITDALSSITGNYSIVWAYDASDTGDHWKKYDPSAPFGNDLTNMEAGKGYWIMMTTDDILEI